ncbi:ABC transporter ATP-binding protein [bacterium]|nr:ABC transporter ATP-binding protein [bacterium]
MLAFQTIWISENFEKQLKDQALVQFRGISKSFDGAAYAVRDLNLSVERGEFFTLLGPSGSGKTTTLMLLAGFESPTTGEIFLDGKNIVGVPPYHRNIGVVFQHYALFPHLSVFENIAYPLRMRGVPRGELSSRVGKILEVVELDGLESRATSEISGGQAQRVALARALVFEPPVVLMDEPLGALDKRLRETLQEEIRRVHRELSTTVIYVTHDQSEALFLSDRIALFREGVVEQIDSPNGLYCSPKTSFAAGFIGENNSLEGKIVSGSNQVVQIKIHGSDQIVHVPICGAHRHGAEVTLCIRPEYITASPSQSESPQAHRENEVRGYVQSVTFHGDHWRYCTVISQQENQRITVPLREKLSVKEGEMLFLRWEISSGDGFVVD